MTPTQRTLKLLRDRGYVVGITEHWNQFTHTKKDLFNFIDLIAVGKDEIIGVQTTSGSNHAARLDKILGREKSEDPKKQKYAETTASNAMAWLNSGAKILLLTWRKNARGRYDFREQYITLETFSEGYGEDIQAGSSNV